MTTHELSKPDFELIDHALEVYLGHSANLSWPDNARARKLRQWFHDAHSATVEVEK